MEGIMVVCMVQECQLYRKRRSHEVECEYDRSVFMVDLDRSSSRRLLLFKIRLR
jgi:hypothetical protein